MEMIDSHGDMFMRQINVTVSYTLTDPTVNKTDAFSITLKLACLETASEPGLKKILIKSKMTF